MISPHPKKLVSYFQGILISGLIGICCGVASATFLLLLEKVTFFREQQNWMLWFLPLGGAGVGLLYHTLGKTVERGSHLIIDEFHDPKKIVPLRMTPLVLLGTLLTHLVGGSAGREGTAIQMGGSIADQFPGIFKLNRDQRRVMLMAGMSGGFGSVFGVPFAGAIFGLEVLFIGRLQWWAVLECLSASLIADLVTRSLGVHHTDYARPILPDFNLINIASAVVAGVLFGLTARFFSVLSHKIGDFFRVKIASPVLRPVVGGALIAVLFWVIQTDRYAGLGIPVLVDSFKTTLPLYDWLAKLSFTALTLGSGFKGGEVTPLLFIGATLGNALHTVLSLPFSSLAVMGFAAVFAGAANTPLACTVMAAELFGPELTFFVGIACYVSFLCSGHNGIYHTQRFRVTKTSYFNSQAPH